VRAPGVGRGVALMRRRYRLFEGHMDEYLDEEVEAAKRALDEVCRAWAGAQVRF
jgi:hypothetical protein